MTLRWPARLTVIAVAAVAYLAPERPRNALRRWAREAAGAPPYESWWGLVEHALLYTTLTALVCTVAWLILARLGWLGSPRALLRAPSRQDWLLTLALGVGLSALNLGLYVAFGGTLRPHWVSGWITAGNLFSNFYEEWIYRGFLLAATRAVVPWPWVAVALNAVVFALSHTQYPWAMKLLVGIGGAALAWLTVRTRSIWPAWAGHQLGDMLLDPLV